MGTYNFLDTDVILESVANSSIPEIFAEGGEEAFRDIEEKVLDGVHAYVRCVISTGGGIVCRLENWSKLQTGMVVWLDVDPKVIVERIRGSDRPLLQGDDPLGTLERLLEERKDRYGQADLTVKVEAKDSVEDTANNIVRALHDFIDDNPAAWKVAKAKAQAEGLDWVK